MQKRFATHIFRNTKYCAKIQHHRFYATGGMFSAVTSKMTSAFKGMFSKTKLTKADIDMAMAQVKVALLQADVSEHVVKQLIRQVSEDALGNKVSSDLPKAAFVYAQVLQRLQGLLGEEAVPLQFGAQPPSTLLVVGVQGSGKTTTCAKLAHRIATLQKKKVLLASLDVRRPAAQEQLELLAKKAGIEFFKIENQQTSALALADTSNVADPVTIAQQVHEYALSIQAEVVILDTAGRLHVDEPLMKELQALQQISKPQEVLLVADSMLGADAVRMAKQFHDRIGLTGICLTRLDGDARGGAAISMRAVTGVPIKFVGVGEKLEELEPFVPSSIANRIMGEGDMQGLATKAMEAMQRSGMKEEQVGAAAMNLLQNKFTFDDYLTQLKQMNAIGSLKNILEYMPSSLIPNKEAVQQRMDSMNVDGMLQSHQKIIEQMSAEERKEAMILKSSSGRRHQLAQAAGVNVLEVNKMLKMYDKIKDYSKTMSNTVAKDPNMQNNINDMMGGGKQGSFNGVMAQLLKAAKPTKM